MNKLTLVFKLSYVSLEGMQEMTPEATLLLFH